MTIILRKEARKESNVFAFIARFQNQFKNHVCTGVRELAKVWYSVH